MIKQGLLDRERVGASCTKKNLRDYAYRMSKDARSQLESEQTCRFGPLSGVH